MKARNILWALMAVVVVILAGCQKAEPTAVVETDVGGTGSATGGQGGMGGVNGLALGMLELEDTAHALTPAQAADLLPLWQIVEGGSLQGDAETEAVLKQIEDKMTGSQLAAIEGMELTWQDMQVWMEGQGIEMQARPEGQQGGGGAFQNMSEDERAQMRQEFQNMTVEQRATRMAEMGIEGPQGQGGEPGGAPGARPGGGGMRGGNVLLEPLITMLSERATQ